MKKVGQDQLVDWGLYQAYQARVGPQPLDQWESLSGTQTNWAQWSGRESLGILRGPKPTGSLSAGPQQTKPQDTGKLRLTGSRQGELSSTWMHCRGLFCQTPAHLCAQLGPEQPLFPLTSKGQRSGRKSAQCNCVSGKGEITRYKNLGGHILCHLWSLAAQGCSHQEIQKASSSRILERAAPGTNLILEEPHCWAVKITLISQDLAMRTGRDPLFLQCLPRAFHWHHQIAWQRKTIKRPISLFTDRKTKGESGLETINWYLAEHSLCHLPHPPIQPTQYSQNTSWNLIYDQWKELSSVTGEGSFDRVSILGVKWLFHLAISKFATVQAELKPCDKENGLTTVSAAWELSSEIQ